MKSSSALFLANSKTFTCTSCNFTQNGFDTAGIETGFNQNLLSLTILEGYTYQLISCTFDQNQLSNTPVLVTDNSATAKVADPSSVNFLMQDVTFTSNVATDNAGSFKILNNAWLYV